MELRLFKTLWGYQGSIDIAIDEAVTAGLDGIEGGVPTGTLRRVNFSSLLKRHGLRFIAKISMPGDCFPNSKATLSNHLQSFYRNFEQTLLLEPEFVNCLAGSDTWSESESVDFFENALSYAKAAGVPVSFETHRGGSLFNPWVTQRILEQLPGMEITCDFSHWCVVCERLMDSELDVIEKIAPRARHIHARVGYDQGPQVPNPAAPEYQGALVSHQKLWEIIWRAQKERGFRVTTMTPEFGPDGYLHQLPFTGEPVANLWELNKWMANKEQSHFETFIGATAGC